MVENEKNKRLICYRDSLYYYLGNNLFFYHFNDDKWEKIGIVECEGAILHDGIFQMLQNDDALVLVEKKNHRIYCVEKNTNVIRSLDASIYVEESNWYFLNKTGDCFTLFSQKYDPIVIHSATDLECVEGWLSKVKEVLGRLGYVYVRMRNENACDCGDFYLQNICTNNGDVIGVFGKRDLMLNKVICPKTAGINRGIVYANENIFFANTHMDQYRLFSYNMQNQMVREIVICENGFTNRFIIDTYENHIILAGKQGKCVALDPFSGEQKVTISEEMRDNNCDSISKNGEVIYLNNEYALIHNPILGRNKKIKLPVCDLKWFIEELSQ